MDNSSNKKFDIEKAYSLLVDYVKNNKFAKASFIAELISYQNFFGNTSIVNCKLGLSKVFRHKTVKSVLADMDYKMISFYSQTNCSLYGTETYTFSVLTFTTIN